MNMPVLVYRAVVLVVRSARGVRKPVMRLEQEGVLRTIAVLG